MNKQYPYYSVEPFDDLKEMLEMGAEKNPEKAAFRFYRDKEIVEKSFSEFRGEVNALGTALYRKGFKAKKIALIGENAYPWLLTFFAVANGDNLIVPIDKEASLDDIAGMLQRCGADAVVYSESCRDVADHLQKTMPGTALFSWNVLPQWITEGRAAIEAGDDAYLTHRIDPEETTAIIFTSGTTAASKGVMLSHKNFAADVTGILQIIEFAGQSLLVLPLHHTFALTAGMMCMFHSGRTVMICRSLRTLSQDIKTFQPQNMMLVPMIVNALYKNLIHQLKKQNKLKTVERLAKLTGKNFGLKRRVFKKIHENFGGKLELIVSGGAPIDADMIRAYERLGIQVLNGYGITECTPVVATNRNRFHNPESVGQIVAGIEVRTKDGEVQVKGDIVMQGYYDNPEATAEAFDGDWFRTGDLGFIDEKGFLHITGRCKNMIVFKSGKKVYPEELETKIQSLDYIKEIIVRERDDTLIAEVFLDAGNEQAEALLRADILRMNKTLPAYKKIADIVIRDQEFPKTATNKIIREKR